MRSIFVSVGLILALAALVSAAPLKSVCAVCREGEEPVAATVRHQDHEHHFCSAGCAEAFKKEPARYHAEVKAEVKHEEPASGSAAPSCPV